MALALPAATLLIEGALGTVLTTGGTIVVVVTVVAGVLLLPLPQPLSAISVPSISKPITRAKRYGATVR